MSADTKHREGSLEAPTRHPIDWQSESFYNQDDLNVELERVFDICHGCRRCVNLCDSFPTLFDLVDDSDTMEVDGVDKSDYQKVVDQCYLCDMCYMTMCPYVPPHEWNIDFPHLMLRAKAINYRKEGASLRDKIISNTDGVGRLASIPVIDITVNALNANSLFRKALDKSFGVAADAPLPKYHAQTLSKRATRLVNTIDPETVGNTSGKVLLFGTCYAEYNRPEIGEDTIKVFQHNGIHIELLAEAVCCGMPKLELGDLESVQNAKNINIPLLMKWVEQGFDIVTPIPSCTLMFKQELPLMFPEDEQVKKVQAAFFDPFEYLWLRHKRGKLNVDFKQPLGNVSYQVACHLRVQNIGMKTRDILNLINETKVFPKERCSGHDGTYAVKKETREKSKKIAGALVRQIDNDNHQYLASDCPMAGDHLAHLSNKHDSAQHPMTLLRLAYGL